MISKELLSEVLLDTKYEECVRVEVSSIGTNLVYYSFRFKEINSDGTHNFQDEEINIHELAHKCKEWAYEKNYFIYSIFTFAGEGSCYITSENNISKRLKTFDENTEPEAIFKACQWILDNAR